MKPWRELTDKETLGYFAYYRQAAELIGPAGRVLEVGVDHGGSLLMWQELFPDGLVAGVDNSLNAVWPEGTVKIAADQASEQMAAAAAAASPSGYDLVVDDASHIGKLSARTFDLLWPLVRPGRWYVLEDWAVGYLPQYGFDSSMLRLAESFLTKLGFDSEVDEIRYRFSHAMIHKREAP
jgi:cephalosporin hydroxylase